MINQFQTAIQTLNTLHDEIFIILDEVGVDNWNWQPDVPEINSLYAIATHTISSQYWWIQENLNQVKITRDRNGEFTASANDLDELKKLYQRVQNLTAKVLEATPETELQDLRSVGQRRVTVEWIIFHIVEHTALHLGHMQITKQLLEKQLKG